jgi:hypothetical protein
MTQKEFDPSQEVFLEEEPKWEGKPIRGHHLPPRSSAGSGAHQQGRPPLRRANDVGESPSGLYQKVEIISESNNRLRLRVGTTEDSLLVLSDTYYPGWKVFVNGEATKICRANYTCRGVPLNAGAHSVEFVYDPISFKLGAGMTFLGILGCIFFGWAARRTRKA